MSLKTLKNEFESIKTKIHPLFVIGIKEDIVDKLNIKKSVMVKYLEKMSKAQDNSIKKEMKRLNKRYGTNYKVDKKQIDLFKKSCSMILELVK